MIISNKSRSAFDYIYAGNKLYYESDGENILLALITWAYEVGYRFQDSAMHNMYINESYQFCEYIFSFVIRTNRIIAHKKGTESARGLDVIHLNANNSDIKVDVSNNTDPYAEVL